jgi:hypothetical protein
MNDHPSPLHQRIRRYSLILGVLQVTFGCLLGFIPPPAVEWFRGLVMAHIEYTANGVLVIAFAFLVPELRLGAKALWAWLVLLQLGTWANGTAGLVGAIAGQSSLLLTTLNEKFPPPHGTAHAGVTGLLELCGLTLMAALILTLVGLIRRPKSPL